MSATLIHDEYEPERSVISVEPDTAATGSRATAMRSLAAVGVVFGTVAVGLLPCGILQLHQGHVFGDARVPLFDAPVQDMSLDALWLVISSLSGAGLGMLLLVGSLGALGFRAWARPLLIAWGVGSLSVGVAGIFFEERWIFSPNRLKFAQVRGVVDLLANLGGWGVGSALAVAILCLLLSPRIKNAFRAKSPFGES